MYVFGGYKDFWSKPAVKPFACFHSITACSYWDPEDTTSPDCPCPAPLGLPPPCPQPRTPIQSPQSCQSLPQQRCSEVLVSSSPQPCPTCTWGLLSWADVPVQPWSVPVPMACLAILGLYLVPVTLTRPGPCSQTDILACPQAHPTEVPDVLGWVCPEPVLPSWGSPHGYQCPGPQGDAGPHGVPTEENGRQCDVAVSCS